jgi:hypothetical protein
MAVYNPGWESRTPASWRTNIQDPAVNLSYDSVFNQGYAPVDTGTDGQGGYTSNEISGPGADAVGKAFYGGIGQWGRNVAGRTAMYGGLATLMGANNVNLGDVAVATAAPMSFAPGIMGNTLSAGMGIDRDTSASAQAIQGLGSLFAGLTFGPIGSVITRLAGPLGVDAVKDLMNVRPTERVRDALEDSHGYFGGRKVSQAGFANANKSIADTEGAWSEAMSAYDDAKTPEDRAMAMQTAMALGDIAAETEASNPMSADAIAMRNLRETDFNNIATQQDVDTMAGIVEGWAGRNYNAPSMNPNSIGYAGGFDTATAGNPSYAGLTGPQRASAINAFNQAQISGQMAGGNIGNILAGFNGLDSARADAGVANSFAGVDSNTARDRMASAYADATSGGVNGNFGGSGYGDPGGTSDSSDTAANSAEGNYGGHGPDGGESEGSGSTGGGMSGGTGAGNGRVVCTELVRQNLMSKKLLKYEEFHTLHNFPTYAIRGYHFWAVPYVRLMQKYSWATKLAKCFIWRAEEIAFKIGKAKTGNWKGKILRWIVEPICYAIGPFVKYDKADKRWDRKDSERLLDKGEI